jgi:NADPH-dependent ferric siderophore reductase
MGRRGGPDAPWRFFDLRVARTRRLGPTVQRVTFSLASPRGGPPAPRFHSGGRDQRFKLFFPHPYQDTAVVPRDAGDDWFAAWQAMDPQIRGIMRTYTARELRRGPDELDVDFALHGDLGPASRWAVRARPGDRLTALGPTAAENRGVDFRPPPGTDCVLLAADEAALPAVAGILRSLPPGIPAHAWIEVAHPEDVQRLSTAADARIEWLVRAGARGADLLGDAVRFTDWPGVRPYAWIAGECTMVRSLRRVLVSERGVDRRAVTFSGYWRLGASEEDLIVESLAAAA